MEEVVVKNYREDIESIIAESEQQEEEIVEIYFKILDERKVMEADRMLHRYQKEIIEAQGGKMTDEQIKFYLINFGYINYVLGASLARQGLASDLTNIHYEVRNSTAFSEAKGDGKRKPTREDKQAEATLATQAEATVNAIYTRATQAIEQRIRSVNTHLRTLETIATMSMSAAKVGRLQ